MQNYVVTCSSTCDLTKEYLTKHNNPYVSFTFLLDNIIYVDDFYDNISIENFYDKIKTKDVKTSQPEPYKYEEMWENILKEEKDVFHIELSSGISGAYNSSLIVKEMLLEKYPDRKIVVIDSLCCSTGYGFLLMKANEKKENMTIDELEKYIESIKLNIHHIFIPNIEQLIKGGRIPAPIGMVAKAINIVPILYVDENGKLNTLAKTRGMNKAMIEIKNYISEHIDGGENYNGKFISEHIAAKDTVNDLYNYLKETYKSATIDDEDIYSIGSVIGAHVGGGTFGLFFVGDGR